MSNASVVRADNFAGQFVVAALTPEPSQRSPLISRYFVVHATLQYAANRGVQCLAFAPLKTSDLLASGQASYVGCREAENGGLGDDA